MLLGRAIDGSFSPSSGFLHWSALALRNARHAYVPQYAGDPRTHLAQHVATSPDRANFLIATECRGESTRSWIIQLKCQHSLYGFSVRAAGARD